MIQGHTYGVAVEQGRFYMNRITSDGDVTRISTHDNQRDAQLAAMKARVADGCDPISGKSFRHCGGEVRQTFLGTICTGCGRGVVLTDDGDWAHV